MIGRLELQGRLMYEEREAASIIRRVTEALHHCHSVMTCSSLFFVCWCLCVFFTSCFLRSHANFHALLFARFVDEGDVTFLWRRAPPPPFLFVRGVCRRGYSAGRMCRFFVNSSTPSLYICSSLSCAPSPVCPEHGRITCSARVTFCSKPVLVEATWPRIPGLQ